MPYIKKEKRPNIDMFVTKLSYELNLDPDNIHGNLNYTITRLIDESLGDKLSYKKLQDMVGMLECCKLELTRRLVDPYEQLKAEQNGDAYKVREL
jgi:hypothetical protein